MKRPMLSGLVVAVVVTVPCEGPVGLSARGGETAGPVAIKSFLPEPPLCRARRAATVKALLENTGPTDVQVRVRLVLPRGVRIVSDNGATTVRVPDREGVAVCWQIEAEAAGAAELRVAVEPPNGPAVSRALTISFLPPVEQRKLAYIPEPAPAPTPVLIGAHHCPLWEADKPQMWANILKHPERTPALGFYSQENPEVSDWETKWAVEHGVGFFLYCWYRDGQGGPVKMRFGSAIHEALFQSRFRDRMQFAIMWENQSRGHAGVADEKDLLTNLLPFWIAQYFKKATYVKVDNRPLLFIYRPEFLIQDLGGEANVRQAFDRMREACRAAGFDGLYLLGEYRGLDRRHLELMKRLGLDYTFAYCWHVPGSPTPEQALRAQLEYIRQTQELNVLPQVVTVSQAWSGWRDEGSIWKIPPRDYETLLRQAQQFIATLPEGQLGRRLLLLDNWNEWGEGHYIAPYREYGFGYLDAVRNVFSPMAGPHTDLLPEDIGMGPYDAAFRSHFRQQEEQHRRLRSKVRKTGGPTDGLIGWWAFDEDKDSPFALDYSGHRLGGTVRTADRAPGIDGSALDCRGGCVLVPNDARLSPQAGLTVACWIRTDQGNQDNKWFVNRVLANGTDTGYRLGLLRGKPCFEVPQTEWSHHLTADVALPTGRWVHVAGTFDGTTMQIYLDGQERGTLPRPGPIRPNQFPLCLGNYTEGHAAHFTGLLDEVRLYDRPLTRDELRTLAQRPPGTKRP